MGVPSKPPPGWQAPTSSSPATLGIVSLVASTAGFIIALGPLLFWVFGMAAATTGVIVGIVALRREAGRGMAIAGIVIGIVALLVAMTAGVLLDDLVGPGGRSFDIG